MAQPAWFVDPRRPTVLRKLPLNVDGYYAESMPSRGGRIDEKWDKYGNQER